MTPEDQALIDAIWEGQDPNMSERELKMLLLGLKIMAEEMAKKDSEGLMVAYEAPIHLH